MDDAPSALLQVECKSYNVEGSLSEIFVLPLKMIFSQDSSGGAFRSLRCKLRSLAISFAGKPNSLYMPRLVKFKDWGLTQMQLYLLEVPLEKLDFLFLLWSESHNWLMWRMLHPLHFGLEDKLSHMLLVVG